MNSTRPGNYYTSAIRHALIEVAERLAGSGVAKALGELGRTEGFSREELLDYQWQKLRTLLAHAYENVPYYRRVFDREGIRPEDIRTREDFARVPVLTKAEIRDNIDDMKVTSLPGGTRRVVAQTGGTTGEPLKFSRDTRCNSFTRAALLRSYAWTGYRLGDPLLFLTGGSLLGPAQTLRQRLSFRLLNYYFMPGFRLSADVLADYTDGVRSTGVKYLRGYSTLLHHFAELCERAGVDDVRLAAVYPTAEMLTAAQRETIARVFHTRVYDQYGCAEINTLANECPEGGRFHVIEEHVLMEEVSTGELGDHALVLTDLDNYAQPFIRYANGDRGVVVDANCACGRNLAVLDSFLGRSSDEIVLASGERYPGVFFHHLFGHFQGVARFQVVQDRPGELIIRVVKNARYADGDEARIRGLVEEHTGIVPHVDYVAEIHREPGTKLTSVICNVPRGG